MVGSWFGVNAGVALREDTSPADGGVEKGTLVGVAVTDGAGVEALLDAWLFASIVKDRGRLSPAFAGSAWKRL